MKNIKNLSDEIFTLNAEFSSDTRIDKINGGIGIYLDNFGKPFVIPVIKKIIPSLDFSNFNYLPINGDPVFLEESAKLILGKDLYNEYKNQLTKQGTDGGTNGLFIWASLVKFINPKSKIIVSNPTWENHKKIFDHCGLDIIEYNHINKLGLFDFNSFKETISKHPNSFVLFHGGSTHNPTGVNPSVEEWKEISKITKNNNNYVLFDFAYLGLGEDVEKDCFPIRHFLERKNKLAIVISYSKNMTLYQHRAGVLLIPTTDIKEKERNELIIKYLFRLVNQTPTAFGEIIAKNILNNEEYKNEWLKSLSEINQNIRERRKLFNQHTNNKFSEIVNQKGLYSLLKITPLQAKTLKEEHGIYLLSTGRINFGGTAIDKIPKLAKALMSLKD